jgi:hypothetical protein
MSDTLQFVRGAADPTAMSAKTAAGPLKGTRSAGVVLASDIVVDFEHVCL